MIKKIFFADYVFKKDLYFIVTHIFPVKKYISQTR